MSDGLADPPIEQSQCFGSFKQPLPCLKIRGSRENDDATYVTGSKVCIKSLWYPEKRPRKPPKKKLSTTDTMKSVYTGLGLIPAVWAASRTSAPSGCITVAGSGGDFSSVQSAVDSLSTSDGEAQCIFIEAGTYDEQVLVPARSAQLSIYGSTSDDTSYAGNTVTIVSGLSQADGLSNDETATLRVKADGFRLYNVNVENSYGEGSQAVALSAYASSGYYGSSFIGFQDTVLSNVGDHVFLASTIVGATDFIFGQQARAWFEGVDIRVVARSLGYVTGKSSSNIGDLALLT